MRFAIYFAPGSSSQLHQLGSSWLGRDAFAPNACIYPAADLAEITAEPRRYGFHATLKPPFALKDEVSFTALESAVEALAQVLMPFEIVLSLRQLDGFLALVPDGQSAELDHLSAACVRGLDSFRKPASEEELARRRKAGLSPRQDEYLERWGYPYVLDEFRFHMTLSRRLSEFELQAVIPMAEAHFAPVLGQRIMIDALAIFVEPRQMADFELRRRFHFPPLSP